MRSKEQTEAITNLQECRDSTRRISFQSHGQPMQTFENGCGRTKNTDFEPLHYLDTRKIPRAWHRGSHLLSFSVTSVCSFLFSAAP